MRVVVFGLWHLGCVTAACLAAAGHRVIGLDLQDDVVADLRRGVPPLEEPGLADLVRAGLEGGSLSVTTRPAEALADAEVLWVAFDTPVNDQDEADVGALRTRLEAVAAAIPPGTLVLVSSQVPVGFTTALARDWEARALRFAYSPENLRLGQALQSFREAERVVVGAAAPERPVIAELLRPLGARVEWMSIESAEMTKHALNAFLATSVALTNELARLCEVSGADAREVERGLRGDPRVGPRAYVSPGGPIAGGTLARDVRILEDLGTRLGAATPLLNGVLASNALHAEWVHDRLRPVLGAGSQAVVAVLGLTYKPGTSTLRRSAAVETCRWLVERGARVRAHDPAIHAAPPELASVTLCPSPEAALAGADAALIATPWPAYRGLGAEVFARLMRRALVIDPGWFLAGELEADGRIRYAAVGRRRDA